MAPTLDGSASDPNSISNQSQNGTSNESISDLANKPEGLCSPLLLGDWRGSLTILDGFAEPRPVDSLEALDWCAFKKAICPDEPTIITVKKEAPYFLPCLLRDAPLTGKTLERAQETDEPIIGKMRSKDHVTSSNALIYDFDGIEAPGIEQIRSFLEERALTYLAYTTFSHGMEGKPGMRVRLCIPVDRPLDAEAYTAAWHGFVALLPVAPDATGSKLCQQQGTWVCHPDRTDQAQRWSNDAGLLSFAALEQSAVQQEPAPTTVPPTSTGNIHQEYPPSDPNLVADRCKQIGTFRDTLGVGQTEPLWNDSIGVVGHCVDGRTKAHEWSSGHPGYSEAETDRKLDRRLKAGPTTCAQFRNTNPDGCVGCKENVKSPITLGTQRQRQSTSQSTQVVGGSPFHSVAAYPEPIDPKQLIDEVVEALTRFIIMNDDQRVAVAFWIAHSWFIAVAQVAPLLVITAAERESGKTQLLTIASQLCCRPMTVANSTTAFLFRAIEKWEPTLFIDEADTFMRESADQKGLINAGHSRQSAWVGRVVGDAHEPTMFNVFCPKALAGIDLAKHLPDATMSRGIVISLRRKLPAERCDRLRHADPEQFMLLNSKLARFAQDYAERIKSARPTLPDALSDRQQDNWEPLFAIAECAGPGWLARCEAAALALCRSADLPENAGNSLLGDIREILERKRCDKISSAELVSELTDDVEAGWAAYNRGKPITPRQVAKLLRPYGITPKTVRLGPGNTPKGYDLVQFDDAFTRYLAAPDNTGADSPDATPNATPDATPEFAF